MALIGSVPRELSIRLGLGETAVSQHSVWRDHIGREQSTHQWWAVEWLLARSSRGTGSICLIVCREARSQRSHNLQAPEMRAIGNHSTQCSSTARGQGLLSWAPRGEYHGRALSAGACRPIPGCSVALEEPFQRGRHSCAFTQLQASNKALEQEGGGKGEVVSTLGQVQTPCHQLLHKQPQQSGLQGLVSEHLSSEEPAKNISG